MNSGEWEETFRRQLQNPEINGMLEAFMRLSNRQNPCSLSVKWLDAWKKLDVIDFDSPNRMPGSITYAFAQDIATTINRLVKCHLFAERRDKVYLSLMQTADLMTAHLSLGDADRKQSSSRYTDAIIEARNIIESEIELHYAGQLSRLIQTFATYRIHEYASRRLTAVDVSQDTTRCIAYMYMLVIVANFALFSLTRIPYASSLYGFHVINSALSVDMCMLASMRTSVLWFIARVLLRRHRNVTLSQCISKPMLFARHSTQRVCIVLAVMAILNMALLRGFEFWIKVSTTADRTAATRLSLTPQWISLALIVVALYAIPRVIGVVRNDFLIASECPTCSRVQLTDQAFVWITRPKSQ